MGCWRRKSGLCFWIPPPPILEMLPPSLLVGREEAKVVLFFKQGSRPTWSAARDIYCILWRP